MPGRDVVDDIRTAGRAGRGHEWKLSVGGGSGNHSWTKCFLRRRSEGERNTLEQSRGDQASMIPIPRSSDKGLLVPFLAFYDYCSGV